MSAGVRCQVSGLMNRHPIPILAYQPMHEGKSPQILNYTEISDVFGSRSRMRDRMIIILVLSGGGTA